MLLQLAGIVVVVLIFDRAAFWQVGNWSRTFRGESPGFSYRETMFPRLLVTLLGCVAFLYAKLFSDERIGVVLFFVAGALIILAHGYLYYKAIKLRRQRR